MKLFYIIIVILFSSCSEKKTAFINKIDCSTSCEKVVPEFQLMMDSADVKGAILIYDFQNGIFYSNDFEWARKGKLPASTFKIPNSIIALETKVVANDSTLFKWNGEKRSLPNWEKDLIFKDAFQLSCVPCYKEVARDIGPERMNYYLDKLKYGSMIVDSTNIDMFWLEGDSQISQFQQIDFLKRFYYSELPISEQTEAILKRMMLIEENDGYRVSGKTGWSIKAEKNNGWFVGYIESRNQTYFFATNVEPKLQVNIDSFLTMRKEVTYKAFKQLKGQKEIVKKFQSQ